MFTSIWVAIVFLAASPDCATDNCLWQAHTMVMPAQDLQECEDILFNIKQHENVSFSQCSEIKLNDD